ncbi:hypothetical protein HK100_007562, partial [Physocladia obscura]
MGDSAETIQPYFSAQDRTARRLQNTRGTLGAKVNLDGTVVAIKKLAILNSRSNHNNTVAHPLLYFGGQSSQERQPKHGPGLAASIYSDLLLNLEKKKASQREL